MKGKSFYSTTLLVGGFFSATVRVEPMPSSSSRACKWVEREREESDAQRAGHCGMPKPINNFLFFEMGNEINKNCTFHVFSLFRCVFLHTTKCAGHILLHFSTQTPFKLISPPRSLALSHLDSQYILFFFVFTGNEMCLHGGTREPGNNEIKISYRK